MAEAAHITETDTRVILYKHTSENDYLQPELVIRGLAIPLARWEYQIRTYLNIHAYNHTMVRTYF